MPILGSLLQVSCSLDPLLMGGGGVYVGGTENRWGNGICPEITTQGPSAMAKVVFSSILGVTNQGKVIEAQAAAAGFLH